MLGFWWHWLWHPLRCVRSYIGSTFTSDSYLCKKCGAAWEVWHSYHTRRDLYGRVQRCTDTAYRRLGPDETKDLKKFREAVTKNVDTL